MKVVFDTDVILDLLLDRAPFAEAAVRVFSLAETGAVERRGNLRLSLTVKLTFQDRSKMTPEQIAAIQTDLDSIGFTFNHPAIVISPALAFEFRFAEPLAGENFYFLHFGDLSQPTRDVIWSGPAQVRGPLQVLTPAKKSVLDRLAAGEIVSLTAARFADATSRQADAVYSLELTSARQASSVSALLSYITGAQLGEDFTALVPPPPAGN